MSEFRRSTRLPHLEARRSSQDTSCYRAHSHDTLSIGLVEAGATVLTGALDGAIRLGEGDVVVIPAGHVHACNPAAGRWRYQMIHLDQDWAAALAPEATELFDGVRVFRRPDLPALVDALGDAIAADVDAPVLRTRTQAVATALDAAAPAHVAPERADPELLDRLATVLHRLGTAETNPALDDLAASVGMTRSQLVRAMRRVTGLSPLAWRQNARVIRARRMLRAGRPIAETAHALGFTDQSHFHRVFRAHVAAPPGAYRG
ncbi:helix-turn-helix transcriptional regulator [Cellulomonas denverensis]|uniref:AraC family transcriptional regulator n=1 Tax=Cellulomonas denverensis TaxID=264297 RepID=A0A7X6KYD6_9CELL|nr:AraC family transcriptional regulator [Cellulomonas denverensis]NKY24465.1 AraC family transcriptional regulator [Cellulomonas denverensis]GIG25381.1 AraC family transcriptional regulator [Cellulomonas denverensis]